MDINKLLEHYQVNYSKKVFMTKLFHSTHNAYLMYIYDYPNELENFADTFLKYLPFYVRNSDCLDVIDESADIDIQLVERSKNIRKKSQIIPKRNVASDGIYGELFLDFYLRIVNAKKAVITYANKRSFSSNYETTGPDNVVYYLDNNEKMNICLCEAKFVKGASKAKNELITDIIGKPNTPGKQDGKPAHISRDYLNDYFQFIVEKGNDIEEPDKTKFKKFFTDLNAQLDAGNDFVSVLQSHDICVNFIFFAIFDSKKREPNKLEEYYNEIYSQCQTNIHNIGLTNYKIEIVFIPTENSTMDIKNAMEKSYE